MIRRVSGILLHVSSLPGAYGIGDLGPEAYRFADFLAEAGQHLWQLLPLGPTDAAFGHSPYHPVSAFAGNPLLISPEGLVSRGWLKKKEIAEHRVPLSSEVNFTGANACRPLLFEQAYLRFKQDYDDEEFERFRRSCPWLNDFALFQALADHYRTHIWYRWPAPIRNRRPDSVRRAFLKFAPAVERQEFQQFAFWLQWRDLRAYCRQLALRIIGDMPIYVPFESADVWAHPEIFKLGRNRRPVSVSGVPPDYFSKSGQLWGHPIYRWDVMKEKGYPWWTDRFRHHFERFDLVRLDHFRGFLAFWEVPAKAKTAASGKWTAAPADDFFKHLMKVFGTLPVIAEDLGIVGPDVREVIRQLRLPGMRVLQFAFGDDFPESPFLPHHHEPNCVVYPGTHDNNTSRGWFENEAGKKEKIRLKRYIGRAVTGKTAGREMIRLAMMSVADTAIICCQDLLGLGADARMNHPGRESGNWLWRLTKGALSRRLVKRLKDMTATYNRV